MKQPEWFKMLLTFEPVVSAIPSVNVGEGVKAAMLYFKTGIEPDGLGEMSNAIYSMLKSSIDQAFVDTEEKSAKARKAVSARYDRTRPHTTVYDRIQPNAEPDKEQEKEITNLPNNSLYIGPAIDEVRAYIDSKGLAVSANDFWEYNNQRQWQIDGKPIMNWRRLLDSWQVNQKHDRPTQNPNGSDNPLLKGRFY